MLNAFRHQRFDTEHLGASCSCSTLCSTPFGIRDSTLTNPQISAFRFSAVLNAFRHQRFDTSTIFFIHFNLFIRAQRLSASEIRHGGAAPKATTAPTSAQRLSASEIRHSFQGYGRKCPTCAQRLSASEIRHF